MSLEASDLSTPKGGTTDLQELARCLRQEKIYVNYEKKQLQTLNENVAEAGRRMAQAAWISHMQRENLEGLVLSRPDYSPNYCCQRANLLLQTQFIDAYKQLSQHMVSYSEFLVALRNQPNLVAVCLAAGDQAGNPNMIGVVDALFGGLLGSCLLAEDEKLLMEVLKKLVDIQLLSAGNPRKMLRHGNCSLSRLYKAFSEHLFSSKLFLTSALYEPILQLLTDDEIYLDIDPSKALFRYPQAEQLRKFGQPGTDEHTKKLKEHRKYITDKLVYHARQFITGIQRHFNRFPVHLASIVRYLFRKMTDAAAMETKDIYAVCVDLLFTMFICPAIVDPQPSGIIDMPISYTARFNLMQVAQIIQVLALCKWEAINPQLADIYSQFDEQVVSKLVESVLESFVELPVVVSDPWEQSVRLSVLLTADQLQDVVDWLRSVTQDGSLDKDVLEEVEKLLSPVPSTVPGRKKTSPMKPESQSPVDSSEVQKSTLAAKLSNVGGGKAKSNCKSVNENLSSTAVPDKVLVIPICDSPTELPGLTSEEAVMKKNSGVTAKGKVSYVGFEENMTFREGTGEVLEKRTRFSLSHDEGSIGNTSDNLEAISEAASNHSVASSLEDEVDPVEDPIIDNLSDMVSANVSGRGTPNVSGRDTPSSQVTEEEDNADPGQEQPAVPPVAQVVNLIGQDAPDNNVLDRRKNGEPDMEERFGRFEIKPEVRRGRVGQLGSTGTAGDRDEAVSMVSDTWSTDVLSSDTETVGEPPTLEDLLRGRPGDEFSTRPRNHLDHLAVPSGSGEGTIPHNSSSSAISGTGQLLDIAETNSEAWSMDVLASDTESFRMRDFDPDDALSVARSDDTRFTDDTTRSDPDQLIQRLELNDFEEGVSTSTSRPARVFQPVKNAAVEQWAELSRVNSGPPEKRRGSDASANSSKQESILKKPPVNQTVNLSEPCLVSLDESTTTDGCNSSVDNFSIGTGDMSTLSTSVRLSTTSIASSASSHGSAASVEAILPPPAKSRSNSSTGVSAPIGNCPTDEQRIVGGNIAMVNTGAIPKSISFDKSADKDEDNEHKPPGGVMVKRDRNFFKNWKLPKIGRNRGGGRGSKNEDYRASDRLTHDAFNIPEHAEGPMPRRAVGIGALQLDDGRSINFVAHETSDDIMAKYRKPVQTAKSVEVVAKPAIAHSNEPDGTVVDVANLESSVIFEDAKRKLRMMLSEVEIPLLMSVPGNHNSNGDPGQGRMVADILGLLRVMLAQALNQQDRNLVAQLYETIRSISNLDEELCCKVVETLKEEHRRRSPYIGYLVKSRQGLLSSLHTLHSLTSRIEAEQRMHCKFLICVCVRLFIEHNESQLRQMKVQFCSTSVMDEKTDLVVRFLDRLWEDLERDPILAAANSEQRTEARIAVERTVFSQIYMAALYPNHDGDISRDRVFQEHMEKLKQIITPGHKDLKIPRRFHYECPWPSAQAELKRLPAFKLPSDKANCVARVATTIMNLLSLAADKSVPAADDFLPVFIYVIIKANPPSLLSTVQFVDNFYSTRLCGENQYWWMQFVAAIEFIKTMEYSDASMN